VPLPCGPWEPSGPLVSLGSLHAGPSVSGKIPNRVGRTLPCAHLRSPPGIQPLLCPILSPRRMPAACTHALGCAIFPAPCCLPTPTDAPAHLRRCWPPRCRDKPLVDKTVAARSRLCLPRAPPRQEPSSRGRVGSHAPRHLARALHRVANMAPHLSHPRSDKPRANNPRASRLGHTAAARS
jgi:hypothetical protein